MPIRNVHVKAQGLDVTTLERVNELGPVYTNPIASAGTDFSSSKAE